VRSEGQVLRIGGWNMPLSMKKDEVMKAIKQRRKVSMGREEKRQRKTGRIGDSVEEEWAEWVSWSDGWKKVGKEGETHACGEPWSRQFSRCKTAPLAIMTPLA